MIYSFVRRHWLQKLLLPFEMMVPDFVTTIKKLEKLSPSSTHCNIFRLDEVFYSLYHKVSQIVSKLIYISQTNRSNTLTTLNVRRFACWFENLIVGQSSSEYVFVTIICIEKFWKRYVCLSVGVTQYFEKIHNQSCFWDNQTSEFSILINWNF